VPAARFLREAKFKPAPRLRRGMVWGRVLHGRFDGSLLGQPRVELSGGKTIMLDDSLGMDFCLLGIDRDPRRALPSNALNALLRLGLRPLIMAQPGGESYGESEVMIDRERRFADLRGTFLAVRPDRFIAAHFQAAQASQVAEHLSGALGSP